MGPDQPTRDREETRPRTPLLIENVYEKETTESFIERHFRDRCLHRCRSIAKFHVDAIADQYGADLVRSAQELEDDRDSGKRRPKWTLLVFRRAPHLLWHFVIKSSSYSADKEPETEYTLVVTADTPAKAAEDVLMLENHFTVRDDAPGFFLLRSSGKPQRIPLKPEYALSAEMLDLHYGNGFSEWTERFSKGLSQNGLSILRGKPGTGKTSFLRHLIFTRSQTHRFYYLPVDSFSMVHGSMAEFLAREQRRFKDFVLVLVLEDAEQLLLNRHDLRDSLASSLLNFTDGFIGDMVQAHLVCTINSEVKDLDAAVLRPGRQRFFHEFGLIDWLRASALAQKLGITLTNQREYSLAELYHFKDLQNAERLQSNGQRQIGFAS
jgi:hypothetical protein